jgi:hypothetical protein
MCHHVDMEIDWDAVVEDREPEAEEFDIAESDEPAVDGEASTPEVTLPADD